MTLTLDDANRIAAGAIEHARSLDILVCVAVCDGGGRLVSFQRMDGAIWAAVYGSQGKAAALPPSGAPAATSPSGRTTRPSAASSRPTAGA